MIFQVSVGLAADLKFLSFGLRWRMKCRSGTLYHIGGICAIVLHSAQSINERHYKNNCSAPYQLGGRLWKQYTFVSLDGDVSQLLSEYYFCHQRLNQKIYRRLTNERLKECHQIPTFLPSKRNGVRITQRQKMVYEPEDIVTSNENKGRKEAYLSMPKPEY